MDLFHCVIAGRDPAIQMAEFLDTRVKPGYDEGRGQLGRLTLTNNCLYTYKY